MKIRQINAHILQAPIDPVFAFSQGWVTTRNATLIEIQTECGITGWGEAFCQGLEVPQIAHAAIEHCFEPMLEGANPLDIEKHWFEMYHRSRDFGRKGAVMAAISGIDIALWDIAAQHYGVPLYQLLGGAFRTEIEPYATGFYRIEGQGEKDRLALEAIRHFENGFRHMKVKLGFGVRDDLQVMDAIATALQGKDAVLMVDTNHSYGLNEAMMLGRGMADYDLRWYEEPVAPEHIQAYASLRQQLPMAIAGGENEHSLYGFRDLFLAEAVDIAQPDLGSCGGITAMRHITALAQAHGVEVNPHIWGSAVVQSASVHVIASLPHTHHSLFPRQPVFEYDQSTHPFRTELTEQPLTLQDGRLTLPAAAGIGITVRPDTLKRYKIN